ncbi:sarcosine oxidase [Neorhizobium galegae]|uniref:NAD(P)/FAD-dependent oxidoreductase n=1 Tax=Neorhizobium galegae TaxID=399 RepID=UPI001AE58D75|nr:FAD-dependent oxidoreductase [Neorhizobium galegae]MBP2549022.1 sarcosine oxidase [Neorhizobium galegae]
MAPDFKYIIIGRGMMGAAAARHLTQWTDGVALIGPDEPADAKTHRGVFASHYDEARITRTIDSNPVWARLANRSIARYGEIERDSGIRFYHGVGCLMVGPDPETGHTYIDGILSAAAMLGVETDLLTDAQLAARFSYFGFEPACKGVFEAHNAGYVNPRALVAAQSQLAGRQGARLIGETVVSVREEGGLAVVRTAEGGVYSAEKALVAAGGFSIAEHLMARPVDMAVYARTVTFFEIPDEELAQFAGMPSLIYEPRDSRNHIYMLPPVRYPDGKTYLKIGGDPDDILLTRDEDMRAWFRSGGRASVRDHHAGIMTSLVPGIDTTRISTGACVVSKTPSGYPAIGYTQSPAIAVLTGGCGAAAKSSDEIGRLGAELLHKGRIVDEAYGVSFAPDFA